LLLLELAYLHEQAIDLAQNMPPAKTRNGTPCKRRPSLGKRRCRLHGGARDSGAPPGERNGNWLRPLQPGSHAGTAVYCLAGILGR
jgi:hypothetical protein